MAPVYALALMQCPFCDTEDSRVVDSRPADGGRSVRRRRACQRCSQRFTTYERIETLPLVRKRDGSLVAFEAAKVRIGLDKALADRRVSAGSVEALVRSIEAAAAGSGSEISSDEIGRLVLAGLRHIDEVAYLRFASVYKEFEGADDFEREMAALEGEG
ncbi:MAG: transcriptional regulator NrdR [Acidimicrobiia bacterium]|nr:transcriptional regulator NrdR [Acidimicrobiia bacterium]